MGCSCKHESIIEPLGGGGGRVTHSALDSFERSGPLKIMDVVSTEFHISKSTHLDLPSSLLKHLESMDKKQPWTSVTDDKFYPNLLIKNHNKECVTDHTIGSAIKGGGGKLNLKDFPADHPVRGTQVFYMCKSVTNCDFDKALGFWYANWRRCAPVIVRLLQSCREMS